MDVYIMALEEFEEQNLLCLNRDLLLEYGIRATAEFQVGRKVLSVNAEGQFFDLTDLMDRHFNN
jgi:hypothetical protein